MNIKKYINNYILLIPFIIVPVLISAQFSDATLVIKRTSLFILFATILFIYILTEKRINKISNSHLIWMFLCFGLIVYLYLTSFKYALNFTESQWGILYLLGCFVISFIFVCFSNDKTLISIFFITSITGGLISLLTLLDYFNVINSNYITFSTGTFGNRNFYGMYLCFVIPASIFSTIISKSKKYSLIHFSILFLSLFSLIQTRSRASWLGTLIGLIFFIIFFNKELILWIRSLKLKKIFLITFIFIILSTMFINQSSKTKNQNLPEFKKSITSTILSIKDIGNEEIWGYRIPMYIGTINMIKDNIFFGVGYENWRFQYPKYSGHIVNDSNYLKIVQRPHNDFLWILSEIGIIGLFLYFVILIVPILYAFKKFLILRRNDDSEKSLIFGFIIISIISIFVNSLFDFPRQRTIPNLYFWTFLGYLMSQLRDKNFINNNYTKLLQFIITVLICLVSYFSINDYKFNYESSRLIKFKNQKQYDEMFLAANKALFYGRNVDASGTPVDFYLGISEYIRKNYLKSEIYFKNALSIFPYHIGILENYMISTARNNKIDISSQILNSTTEIYPNYFNIKLNMIKLHLQHDDYDSAKQIILDIENDIISNKRFDRYDSINKEIKNKLKDEIKKLQIYITNKESK